MFGSALNILKRVVLPDRAVDIMRKCRRLHGRQRGELRHFASGQNDDAWGFVVLKGSHFSSDSAFFRPVTLLVSTPSAFLSTIEEEPPMDDKVFSILSIELKM